jgi:hypothetical protein
MEFIIENISALEQLKQDKNLKLSVRKIKLNANDLDFSATDEKRLNQYYFACGCQSGAMAVGLSILFLVVNHIFNFFSLHWAMIIVIVFSAAFIGKISGLIYAKIEFERLYKKLYLKFLSNQYWHGHTDALYTRIVGGGL